MASRFVLCSSLAASSDSTAQLIRGSDPPFRFTAIGGFTGNVTIEHSPDGGTTWISLGTLGSGDDLSISDPVRLVRVGGDHTAGTATVYMMETYQP